MRPDAIKTEAFNRVAKQASTTARAQRESILAFATRHGWALVHEDSSDYFTNVRVAKGDAFVSMALWPGLRRDVAFAHTHTGVVAVKVPDPVRPRVERFLAGVGCACEIRAGWLDATSEYEAPPSPGCPVHGDIS